jgi:hypothetical protein
MPCLASLLARLPLPYRSVHGSRTLPAHHANTPRSNVAHRRHDVGHLRAPSILGGRSLHPMQIGCNVVKCLYFYRQLPPPSLLGSTKNTLNVAHSDASSSFAIHSALRTPHFSKPGECGGLRDQACRRPSLFPSDDMNISNVIKCNHFPARWPTFTLNTTRRAPDRVTALL